MTTDPNSPQLVALRKQLMEAFRRGVSSAEITALLMASYEPQANANIAEMRRALADLRKAFSGLG